MKAEVVNAKVKVDWEMGDGGWRKSGHRRPLFLPFKGTRTLRGLPPPSSRHVNNPNPTPASPLPDDLELSTTKRK